MSTLLARTWLYLYSRDPSDAKFDHHPILATCADELWPSSSLRSVEDTHGQRCPHARTREKLLTTRPA